MAKEYLRALVYKMKVTKEVAAYTMGKHFVSLKLPLIFPPGTRLFLVEWNGGPTGRADLCYVHGKSDEGHLVLERRWCWHEGKLDDDLSQLSHVLQPDSFAMVTKSVIS